jgi:hypothetical protein
VKSKPGASAGQEHPQHREHYLRKGQAELSYLTGSSIFSPGIPAF